MDENYTPSQVEADARDFWESQASFTVTEDLTKEKFYCLSMLPYPSGQLHVGHVRNYTIGDAIARYHRMQGKNVLQPMGWDAFGLPAENAALKHKIAPAQWTASNIDSMRKQLQQLGFAYDWSRELATCDPNYYRWEQWLFITLYEKGLVYRKNTIVNWDPVDETVLANEQIIDGRGWRSGAPIERREIPQWFFKITDYADELLRDLDQLTGWPEKVKTMQRHWIGRSEGVTIYFEVPDHHEPIKVFTTRADTLFGVTFLVVSPEHPLALQAAKNNPSLNAFIETYQNTPVSEASMATQEKHGMASGYQAKNPLSGELIPVWVSNYVLMQYGMGAVMAVPGHDPRDHSFAKKYRLPVKSVIASEPLWNYQKAAYTGNGVLINSGLFNGLPCEEAKETITQKLLEINSGKTTVHYRLRDWGVSRQRYWGTPIPIIYCEQCGVVPVPVDQLPVILPTQVKLKNSTELLRSIKDFYQTTCPNCEQPAHRETDTFDTFVESSWYFLRYTCVDQDKKIVDDRARYWAPIDQYIGGVEHAVMHLLYARFFVKVLRDLNFINSDEPFINLLTQGMVLKNGIKMSKSKGNTVDPQPLIDKYGADTVRLYMLFAAPPEQSLDWSDQGVDGAFRFLKRLWALAYQHQTCLITINRQINNHIYTSCEWKQAPQPLLAMRRELYEILNQVRFDYERLQFNTVVSGCMKLLNLLMKLSFDETNQCWTQPLLHEGLSILLRLLAPITPHISHCLWKTLNYGETILTAKWPKVLVEALKTETMNLIVQINGKRRTQVTVPVDSTNDQIEKLILKDEAIKRHINNQKIKKVITVPGKLVNLVV